jgi:peptidoglycan/LPS O-acetylase OafA/YrhL
VRHIPELDSLRAVAVVAVVLRVAIGFLATSAFSLALSIILAAISWHTVEAWGRILRDRVEARRRAPV